VSAEVSKFVFTSSAQSVAPNQISEGLSIQAQDTSGNSSNTAQTTCLELTTTSSSGEFSSSNTSWNPVSVLTMNKGSANRNFYYKDASTGTFSLSIKAVPRPEAETRPCASWPVAEWGTGLVAGQDIAVGGSNEVPANQQATQETVVAVGASFSPGTASGEAFPVEPQIFASAGPDKIVIVGADEKFVGQAYGFKKEPLEGARYAWSFGDGSVGSGLVSTHTYKYTGEYIVVFRVDYYNYSANDRVIVKVVNSKLIISEADEEFIKLTNNYDSEINISGWMVRFGGLDFRLPETTIIRAKGEIIIANSVSNLKISGKNDLVELLYPNGLVANIYNSSDMPFIKTVVANKTLKTTVVNYPTAVVTEKSGQPATSTENGLNQNLASVIYTEPKNSSSANNWLLPTAGVGLLAALGYVSIKKQKVELLPEKPGDEFEIEENKF
jgi:hypothetical protein